MNLNVQITMNTKNYSLNQQQQQQHFNNSQCRIQKLTVNTTIANLTVPKLDPHLHRFEPNLDPNPEFLLRNYSE
jgi:hypothetical protein